MTPGEFQLYALGWLDANAPDRVPVTKADIARLEAVRAFAKARREKEKMQ